MPEIDHDAAIRQKMEEAAEKILSALVDALIFYASPDTYFATSFLFDPPCGEFSEDFSEVPGSDYDRPMPGKRARSALEQDVLLSDLHAPLFEILFLASQAKMLEEALRAVKDRRPQVCENFEMCDHIECTASYEAFAIADAVLAALEKKP